ncbi:MAG: domain/GGDEF domain protein, partial [Bacteriovoracaceae bacterium]|nr:domain/GGDEF domain protein [Bacteriovoracaceae bacterium]
EAAFQKELYESATRDNLTCLHSKRFFSEQLEMEFNHHRRTNRPLSLVLLDIDHFKKVNDTHGHPGGDLVLKQLGTLLLNILRKGDAAGRYGGEELIFSLRETPLAGAKIFAERLRRLIETHSFIYEGKRIPVTASFGAATFTNLNYKNAAELVKVADEYLYKAKKGGRNRVACLID